MTNEQIRKKIMDNPSWNGTLMGFENCICKVQFWKNNKYYGIEHQGAKGFYEDQLTVLPMTSIENLVAFMQGALWFRLRGKELHNEEN